MKYLIIALFALVFISPSFLSCQKEDLGNLDGIFSDTAQTGPVSEMTAKINGAPWAASSYTITLNPKSNQIAIAGVADNGQTINLVVANTKQGDYLMNKVNTIGTYLPDSTGTIIYKSNESTSTGGVISIDSIDTTAQVMSGEFNFIGGNTNGTNLNITDGSFIQLGYTNTTKNIEFGALVNGKPWVPKTVSTSVSPSGLLTITALNANGQQINLSFPASIKVRVLSYLLSSSGTYQASYTDAGTTLVPEPLDTNNTKPKLSCTLKITVNSSTTTPKNVQGSFNFYAAPSNSPNAKGVKISSGVFNVNY